MKKLFCWVLAVGIGTLVGASPRIGTTIRGFYHDETGLRSDKIFQGIPVVKEMKTRGLDLCLTIGPADGKSWDKCLKQFNGVWILPSGEGDGPVKSYSADEMGKALRKYVEEGGGLVLAVTPPRYPHNKQYEYFKKVFSYLDMNVLDEEVVDLPGLVTLEGERNQLYYTDRIVPHPVTKEVHGLWIPIRGRLPFGTTAVKYGDGWKTVLFAPSSAKSYRQDNDKNSETEFDHPGFYHGNAPIVAVRELGKGRIVSVAVHKDNSGLIWGTDRWPNHIEDGTILGRKSDMLKLLENSLRWVAEPSSSDPAFGAGYKPQEPDRAAYKPKKEYRDTDGNPPKFIELGSAPQSTDIRGVIGLHSNYSDGKSTVAEYAAEAKKNGISFLFFTDPLELLTEGKLEKLREDCKQACSSDFLAIPGVEYTDSSGIRWILCHETVAWPEKFAKNDFRNDLPVFDGKTILQRNAYGGHQNLYRGAVVDYSALEKAGIDAMNLAYFSWVIPMAYEGTKLIADNRKAMLRTSYDLHRYAPVSFTRIRNVSELAEAARVSATHTSTIESARGLLGPGGAPSEVPGTEWVSIGEGIRIDRFDMSIFPGAPFAKIVFEVSGKDGIKEVILHDADRRILRRFDGKGETSLKKEFTIPFDRQSYPQIEVNGGKGAQAFSVPKWLYNYHDGMIRCGDNSNLMGVRPWVLNFPSWDCPFVQAYKHIYTPFPETLVEEGNFWDLMKPSVKPSSSAGNEWSTVSFSGTDFPGKDNVVSSLLENTLYVPGVGAIFDQYVGKQIQERSNTDRHAFFSYCSTQPKAGENPYYRRHQRTYLFVDRIDTWWYWVYREIMPENYRGGYTIVEGEIEFKKDICLAEPVILFRFDGANPTGSVNVYGQTEHFEFGGIPAEHSGVLKPGGWISLAADPKAWYAIFRLDGSDDLSWMAGGSAAKTDLFLRTGSAGQSFKAGTILRYRFAVGSFTDSPNGGEYLKWFASMLDGSGYPASAEKGKITAKSGVLDLSAEKNQAVVELGPAEFIQDLPIRISGLTDNGSAFRFDGDHFMPLGFENGKAWTSYPLEKKAVLWLGNLFLADNPDLRFTLIPAMSGHPEAEVEIHNPTEKPIDASVIMPPFGIEFQVRLDAGSSVFQKIQIKKEGLKMNKWNALLLSALTVTAAAAEKTFDDCMADYWKASGSGNQKTALEALENAEKLAAADENRQANVQFRKIVVYYSLSDTGNCISASEKLFQMPKATDNMKSEAYFLGGVRLAQDKGFDKSIEWLNKAIELGTGEQKFAAMAGLAETFSSCSRQKDAEKILDEAILLAKEQKNTHQELHMKYLQISALTGTERTAAAEKALEEPKAFESHYGLLIARDLLNGSYIPQGLADKQKALCERVLKEAKDNPFPDFKNALDKLGTEQK